VSAHLEPTVSPATAADEYSGLHVAAAVILTLAAPVISLIAALALRADQRSQAKRRQLTTWAIGSSAWLVVYGIVLFAVASSIASSGLGGCKGGIDRLDQPSYSSSDGTHWTATYQCWNGGTTTRPAHAAWLNSLP
jgi:hypothetical protein